MGRAPCCDKANVKKGPWSPEEDAKLKSYIEHQGTGGNWIALPQKIGLKRCGKSCRLRWLNYLRPNIKHGGFSEEEDNIICSLYVSIGSRWSVIAAQLPGRTDNDIKNYWNTRLKKKLLGKQRKEQQAAARNKAIVKRENNGRSSTSTSTWINSSSSLVPAEPYWPHTNQLGHSFNDQDSITRFLVKLGGRFSDNYYINDQHQPIIDNGLNFQFPNGTCTGTTTTLPSTVLPQEQVLHIGSSSCIINSINNKLQFSDDESHSNNHHQFCGEGVAVAVAVAGPEELVQGQGSFAAANSNDYDQQRWLEFLCGEEEMVMDDKITEEATICGQSCNWDDHDQTTTTATRSSTLIYPSHVAASNNYLLQGHVKQEETPQQYCVFQDQYN